jgi:glycerol-1-phosphate dehydrogenase [NAD(P)+]
VQLEELLQDVENLAGISFQCSCGKTHTVDIKNIRIGSGIVGDVVEFLAPLRAKKTLFVADINTYEAAGRKIELLLGEIVELRTVVYSDTHLVPNETALQFLQKAVTDDIAALVVVGSGTLNDLARYVSYMTGVPYAVVCTAPSMDGYASMVSPLIMEGIKTTYAAVYPHSILADVNIAKDAPLHMLHAGFGEIAGKYTALADWKLSNILHGEYYCETIACLVEKALSQCVSSAAGLRTRNPEAVQKVMEGLLLSGMCIGMAGSSRPASGEEHHLSHTWEMLALMQGWQNPLHGNQVGIGTEIILHIYDYLAKIDMEKIYNAGKYRTLTREKWEKNIISLFGIRADKIIKEKEKYISFDERSREKAAYNILCQWHKVKETILTSIPSPAQYRTLTKAAGVLFEPSVLKLDREQFRLSLIVAKDVRNRYGVLQLLEDMGILEDAAEMITDRYY